MVLDLNGSDIQYKVGDSSAVYPTNDVNIVRRVLSHFEGHEQQEVMTRQGEPCSFTDFLTRYASISRVSKTLLTLIAERQTNHEKRAEIERLFDPDRRQELKSYLEARHLWDLLEEHSEAHLSPQELAPLLSPLLPRFYSIASSPQQHPHEVHLTVVLTEYTSNQQKRLGVCTDYLIHHTSIDQAVLPVYLQPSKDFTLPDSSTTSMIMVGPGTGVAPYRGFMQEREALGHTGKNWLFFGEWNRKTDYLYESEWLRWQQQGILRVDTAFSRDQEEKIYVQHKLKENSAELYQWLEEGAVFYVCGDAQRMAKDVDSTLHQIIEQEGKKTIEEAKEYVKQLRREKRYLRDVY